MRTLQNLSAIERRLVTELRRRIGAELSDIGFRMTVFGSRARGDAEPDSDMDVLIEVDVDHISFADKRRLRRIATDVSITSGIIVSLLVVDKGILAERGDFSVLESVREEGIAVRASARYASWSRRQSAASQLPADSLRMAIATSPSPALTTPCSTWRARSS